MQPGKLNHYYKKSKIQQLKSFCTVVESQMSLTKASKKLEISISSISLQIKSLEYDLECNLFDRKGRKLYLSENGKTYYKELKNTLLAIDAAYNGTININKTHYILIFLKNNLENTRIAFRGGLLHFLNIMVIRLTIKRVLVFLMLAIASIFLYMERTNWWFDKKILNISDPFLKNLIIHGTYRIPPDEPCSFSGCQVSIDAHELIIKLNAIYKNMNIVEVFLGECPIRIMRYNGDPEHDEMFNDAKETVCNTRDAHIATVKTFHDVVKMFSDNSNFMIYSIYRNPEECKGYDGFLQNQERYSSNFIGIKTSDSDKMSNTKFWIFRHKKYYYLISSENVLQSHVMPKNHERRLFFKKLTLSGLKEYDNGSYWNLIVKYNIKI